MKKSDLVNWVTAVLFFFSLFVAVPAGLAVADEGKKGKGFRRKTL